jgi:O-methyltransferase
LKIPLRKKLSIVRQLYRISAAIESTHTQSEMLAYVTTILSLPRNGKGVVVEAGCYKGSSTAKISLAAEVAARELVVFDSFQGLPENEEPKQRTIFGEVVYCEQGAYWGNLEEVRANVSTYGKIDCCRFIPGWFDDTMPDFHEPISAAYLDVDVAASTRTCLKYLYPLLEVGGVLYSQDGHLPLVTAVFDDDSFWLTEVGCEKPRILGLGESKLIKIVKDA